MTRRSTPAKRYFSFSISDDKTGQRKRILSDLLKKSLMETSFFVQ